MAPTCDAILCPSTLPREAVIQAPAQTSGSITKRIPGRNLGLAVILFALIFLVNRASLAHAPRSDQWSFLLDTVDQDGFMETFRRTYSYNRTREVGPGDYHLFRPVLFGLLSAEKAIFGNNFAGWQLVGIVLHFLVVYLTLLIMLQIQRLNGPPPESLGEEGWLTDRFILRMLPYGLALFFGLNFAITETVIFSHINGYVLFLAFIMGGLLFLFHYWNNPKAPVSRQIFLLAGSWLLLLLSSFTHELGQLFAVAVGVVLLMTERGKGRLGRGLTLFSLFAGLLLLYQLVNLIDKKRHPGVQPDLELSTMMKEVPTVQSIQHAARYVVFTSVQPFFPSCASWTYYERLSIQEPRTILGNYRRGGPIMILSYLVVGAGLLLTARGLLHALRSNRKKYSLWLLLLPVSLFSLHMALTVFGRMNMRPGSNPLTGNSYYTYVPLLALLMGVLMLWTRVPTTGVHRRSSFVLSLHAVFLGGLAILTLYSGEQVCAINVTIKNELRSFRATTQWLEEFVRLHQREPDFSFAFDQTSYNDMDIAHGIPLPVILFKRHLNNLEPKYLVSLRKNKCSAAPYEGNRGSRGAIRRQLVPDLVKVGISYNFFYFNGCYYGVQGEDGYYRPDRNDYVYLITDRTLEGAMLQVPVKLSEQDADRRSGKNLSMKDMNKYDPWVDRLSSTRAGTPAGISSVERTKRRQP